MTVVAHRALGWAWRGALGCFVLAGLTGVLFRFMLASGETFGLDLTNVRHAHSHLMYFGWATPALMALITTQLAARTGREVGRGFAVVLGVVFATALLSYPFFLAYGYTPAQMGEKRLPLSVMTAGLNIIGWYAYLVLYFRAARGVVRDAALRCWDLALGFLVLSTLGAWGLPFLKPLGIESAALMTALIHVFLDLFSEGWFVLGVLGLAFAEAGPGARLWPLALVVAGLPFTFALAMVPSMVPPLLWVLANAGGVLVGAGLLAAVALLWRRVRAPLWRLALALLAAKAAGQLVAGLTPGVGWGALPGARILYLHLMLLGFVTLGLAAAATTVWGAGATRGRWVLAAAVLVLLASLVPLTPFWPAAWAGHWAWVAAAWVALLPVFAAAWMAVRGVGRSSASDPERW